MIEAAFQFLATSLLYIFTRRSLMPARSSTRLPSLISGFSMTFAKDLFKRELVNGA